MLLGVLDVKKKEGESIVHLCDANVVGITSNTERGVNQY
jgi:hypothetical protein